MLDNFCALPFNHLMIETDGAYQICCEHKNVNEPKMYIQKNHPNDFLESDYRKSVQKHMLENKRHPGCARCYKKEDNGFSSMRTRTAKEYEILRLGSDQKNPTLLNLEVNLSNVCNLKCVMCSETNSSSLLAENVRLGMNKIVQKDLEWNNISYDHLGYLINYIRPRVLNIRGGEPFYSKKLLEIVENIPSNQAENMILHITTNATIWNKVWQDAISKFKLVRFMFSVDSVGTNYEYIRFPGNWEIVDKNIDSIIQLKNVKGLINSVVQNLNILYIQDLIDWSISKKLYLTLDRLSNPDYLQVTNLPYNKKIEAINVLKTLQGRYPKNINDFLHAQKQELEQSLYVDNTQAWNKFENILSKRDSIRNTSYKSALNLDVDVICKS